MRIICDNCQTEYDVTAAMLGGESPGRRLKFRCSYCGHTFTPDVAERRRTYEDAPSNEAVPDASDPGPHEEPPSGSNGMNETDQASFAAFRGLPPPVADPNGNGSPEPAAAVSATTTTNAIHHRHLTPRP